MPTLKVIKTHKWTGAGLCYSRQKMCFSATGCRNRQGIELPCCPAFTVLSPLHRLFVRATQHDAGHARRPSALTIACICKDLSQRQHSSSEYLSTILTHPMYIPARQWVCGHASAAGSCNVSTGGYRSPKAYTHGIIFFDSSRD